MKSFSRVRRALVNAASWYRLGGYALGCGIFALLVLGGWLPNAFVNMGLFLALAVALVGLAVRHLKCRQRFRSHLDEAFRMEALAGTLNSRLISALDFAGYEQPNALMQVVIDRAQEDIALDYESSLDHEPRNCCRKRFGVALALFLVIGFMPWFSFARLGSNFAASLFAVSEYLFPVVYQVTPAYGKHVHRVGREVDVLIQFASRAPAQVTLVEKVGEKVDRHRLDVDESGRAGHRIKGLVEAEHHLRFQFGERVSDEVLLVFANLPILENMQTELVYPPYTRMVPRSLEGIQQRVFALPRTTITLGFTFSKELVSATFTWDDGDELPLEMAGRFASTSLRHMHTRQASLQVEDKDGFNLEYPFYIDFVVQEDEPPQVFLPSSLKEEMPVMAEGLKLFGFGARVQDDYGVSKCILKWTRSTISNPSRVTARGEIERLVSPPRRKAIESFQKTFENLAVVPGDRISFMVEVYDNRSPNPQKAVSRSKSLFVYQQELEDLKIASLHFGRGGLVRARIGKSKRATSVKEPMGMFTKEKVWNEYDDERINTVTKAPIIPGDYAQAVKDYLRLISTAVHGEDQAGKAER